VIKFVPRSTYQNQKDGALIGRARALPIPASR
jgi:hypothetical protein